MDPVQYNREAWNQQVKNACRWTVAVDSDRVQQARNGDLDLVLTPSKTVPNAWYPDLQNADLLCLASGGGQQGPLFAAFGANVTVFDNSPDQLAQDRMVAQRESLELQTVLGDMNDLSAFADASFDLVFQPASFSFVPNVRPVMNEVSRVLRSGGVYLAGFCNPLYYVFDYDKLCAGELVVRHSIPYSDLESISDEERQQLVAAGEPMCFGHTLQDLIGGQTDAGLRITNFYEDAWGQGPEQILDQYLMTTFATRAIKP